MPRSVIDLPYRVDYLSILDENGQVDRDLEPQLPDELLLKLHWYMLLARRMDERMLTMQRQGRIGGFAPIKGMEAAHLGAIAAIQENDWFVPQLREAAAEFWRGRRLESILLFHNGYEEGILITPEQNNLPIGIIVAGQLPHAVGIAYGMKYRKSRQVALTFLGDGGTSQGDFHEALNVASVFQVPVVFVCQNNQWAISVPLSKQTHSRTLAQKALAYDMPAVRVDGNDVLAVYSATKEAVDRARAGGGPSFIECLTYRVLMHTTSDDPTRYRSEEESEVWLKRDPLVRFQKYLVDKGILDEVRIAECEEQVKAEIQAAIERFA
jgi:pyruvate dehydrogenase E1 component alpha subunit